MQGFAGSAGYRRGRDVGTIDLESRMIVNPNFNERWAMVGNEHSPPGRRSSASGPSDDLDRFVQAQDRVHAQVMAELAAGRKRSHWMWFVFPQLAGLGRSDTARFYGLADLRTARAYGAHPVLGPRLKACSEAVLAHRHLDAHRIFGSPDDLKLCSCMTLFEVALPREPVFGTVLAHFYAGVRDAATLALLADDVAGGDR
jgi:uncharacterized protein (DUF1810 family)